MIGVAFGVFTFAAVIARPVAGWLLDRTARGVVQAFAVVALAITTLSFTWAVVIWAVILFRVLHGLAWGISSTATPTIAADVVPTERRAEGFAYFGIVPNLALMVMPPVGLWIAHRFGFGAQFAGATLLVLLALIPLFVLDETAPATGHVAGFYAPAALLAALLVGLANAGLFFTVMGAAIVLVRSSLGKLPGSMPTLLSSLVLQTVGLVVLATKPRLVVVRDLPLGLVAGAALFGWTVVGRRRSGRALSLNSVDEGPF